MKKKVVIPMAAVVALLFASCDSKLCYCYESTAQGVYESEVYTNTDSPCSALSTSNRGCVEQNERMDPGQIAYK
ncbi:MAG: hypothetical protein J6X79_06730 [Bacteroidales bacterium]|nr:hypothetical protein [Bacteroidales bacterium]